MHRREVSPPTPMVSAAFVPVKWLLRLNATSLEGDIFKEAQVVTNPAPRRSPNRVSWYFGSRTTEQFQNSRAPPRHSSANFRATASTSDQKQMRRTKYKQRHNRSSKVTEVNQKKKRWPRWAWPGLLAAGGAEQRCSFCAAADTAKWAGQCERESTRIRCAWHAGSSACLMRRNSAAMDPTAMT